WGHGHVPTNGDAAPNIDDYNSYDDYNDAYDDSNTTDTEDLGPATTLPPDKTGSLRFLKLLGNVTKEAGQSVKLKCEVTGDPPPTKIRWFKNEAPVIEEKGRLVARRYNPQSHQGQNVLGSRLRITQLDTHDTGYYKCEASNAVRKIDSTGILVVKMNRWGRINAPADIPNFSPVFPNFPGLLEGAGNADVNLGRSPPHGNSGLGPILSPPSGPHTFQPGHSLQPGIGGYGSSTDTVASPGADNTDVSENAGFCQVYRGSKCFNFVGNKTVFVPARMTQRLLEEKLAAAFMVIDHSRDLSPSCESFAVPSLCYSTFPLCREEDVDPTGSSEHWSKAASREPRRICRDDCEILENEICRMEYAIAKRHPLIGQQLALPECGDLPAVASPDSDNCLKLGIPRPENVEPDEVCYTGMGQSYRGTAHMTLSRNKCTPWSHQFYVKTSDYPELAGGHNFCRNPGEMEDKPWCYTEYNQREKCDIPKCVDSLWLYVTVSSTVLAFLLIVLIAYWCCYRRRKSAGANSINRQFNGPANKVSAFKAARVSSPSKGSS
ncbi:hypothetical protein B7P43_G02778, partial [Cryptotermes secundus]